MMLLGGQGGGADRGDRGGERSERPQRGSYGGFGGDRPAASAPASRSEEPFPDDDIPF